MPGRRRVPPDAHGRPDTAAATSADHRAAEGAASGRLRQAGTADTTGRTLGTATLAGGHRGRPGQTVVFGLVGGLDFGLLGGLDNRGASYLRHRLLVVLLERQGLIAADLIRFLDYADGRILLRRAGGGYLSSTGWTRFFVHGCPPAPGFGIIDTGTPACTERTDTSPAGQRAR